MGTAYKQGASDVIEQSTYSVHDGTYIYAKVATAPSAAHHFMVTQDADEITVVTRSELLGSLDLLERNKDDYLLIAMNVSVPFYSVGFLATVSDAFAQRDLNILIVSTYSKDYLLVRADLIAVAEELLLALGFKKL